MQSSVCIVQLKNCCLAKLRGVAKNPDETTGRYFKGWCRRYTEQEVGAHICFTTQSGSGIPRSPYQDKIELRGQFNLRSPFHGLKNRCKTYVCAHFLFCIPSAPSLKIPACCLWVSNPFRICDTKHNVLGMAGSLLTMFHTSKYRY